MLVPVALGESAMAAARSLHAQRKRAAFKAARTAEAQGASMRRARAKAERTSKEAQPPPNPTPTANGNTTCEG